MENWLGRKTKRSEEKTKAQEETNVQNPYKKHGNIIPKTINQNINIISLNEEKSFN